MTTGARSFPRAKRRANIPLDRTVQPSPTMGESFSQRQQVQLIESLYTSGNITREEWRESVWVQAGLKADAQGYKARDGVLKGVEDEMRRLREWYAGNEVPGQLLEEEERRVYERLFGGVRDVEVGAEEVVGEEEVATSGTGVLREKGGVLEEVKFEEEDVKTVGKKKKKGKSKGDELLLADIQAAMEGETEGVDEEAVDLDAEEEESETGDAVFQRTHPLTLANRFETSPSTLPMPKLELTDPIETMLANISNKHITQHAHRIFGGAGLPYSTSTSTRGRAMPQKPIALDAYQSQMAEIEGDVYMASLIPGVYASVMSVLVETRKRLGTQWARDIVQKAEKGELKILDAGGAGAGVLAVRELIRAEWESLHEDSPNLGTPMALAEVDGKVGGEVARPPPGQATVLTGSDTLRKRAAKLLENTTFVPRLPDYVHTEEAKLKGKFDVVIAPHTLWPLKEDYIRKTHVQNLWSLVNSEGGVLMLMEKGVPRGFEMVAGARDMLLETRIASPEATTKERNIYARVPEGEEPTRFLDAVEKEKAMIIAPCTNHADCPMYQQKGLVKGRKDICAFAQRYHRPPFLQSIFGSKGKNHEDVEFSYISVMRGRDLRSSQEETPTSTQDIKAPAIHQGPKATDLAFKGYESTPSSLHLNSLSLPRMILPPLKRKGHVILDLCTPAGTLERWTVPRSFSRQAYRDARKASWGDLWALGAKTRIPRKALVRKPRPEELRGVKADWEEKQQRRAESAEKKRWNVEGEREGELVREVGWGSDDFGRVTLDGYRDAMAGGERTFDGGRVRSGQKIKGIRDKRDKKGDGRGRTKRKNL